MSTDELVKAGTTTDAPRRTFEIRRQPVIAVGGIPHVSLLPRELRTAARERSIRRAMVGVVVLALIIAAGATALADAGASQAQQRLATANAQSKMVAKELGTFADIQKLENDVALGNAAVAVGSSTAIDWQAQIEAIEQDMPAGFTATSIITDSATAVAPYSQGGTPLDKPRAATVQMSVTGPSLIGVPAWLRKLRSIPAFADYSASFMNDPTAGTTINLTIHLSPKALVDAGKASTK